MYTKIDVISISWVTWECAAVDMTSGQRVCTGQNKNHKRFFNVANNATF